MISWLDQSSLVATLLHCRKALQRIYILCSKAAKWDGAFFHHLWPIAVPRRSCLAAVTQQMDDLERYLKLSKIYWKIGPKKHQKTPQLSRTTSRCFAGSRGQQKSGFRQPGMVLARARLPPGWHHLQVLMLLEWWFTDWLTGNHENLLQSSFNLWNLGRNIFVCDWYFRPDLIFCFENPTLVKFEESPLKSKSIKSQEPFHNIFAQHLSI